MTAQEAASKLSTGGLEVVELAPDRWRINDAEFSDKALVDFARVIAGE